MTIPGSTIAGLGVSLPSEEVTSGELAARLELPAGWIESRTGIASRRIAAPQESTSTLGTAAAFAAIADAGVSVADVGLVICATVTPDHTFPASACTIQAALGIDAPAFDLNAGCSGFLFALAQADAAIRADVTDCVVVVGAEVLSRITDPEDRKTAILFGDGAGAACVVRSETPRLGPFELFSDGSRPELLFTSKKTGLIHMEGREVYRAAVDSMAKSVGLLLSRSEVRPNDVDVLVAHQANQRIIDAVAARLGLERATVFSNISRYGNTSAASIPIALFDARAEGLLHDDGVIVLTAFGAGFTWGATLLRWTGAAQTDRVHAMRGTTDA